MQQRLKTDPTVLKRPTWREYQDRLKKTANKERLVKKAGKISAIFLMVFAITYGMIAMIGGKLSMQTQTNATGPSDQTVMLDKRHVQALMSGNILKNLDNGSFKFVSNNTIFHIDTSIDATLQGYLQRKAEHSIARNIGIVCMDPDNGRILSMVGLDKTDPSINPCVNSIFPAASIFKIISAAAAIEQCGFNSNSTLSFNGRKHTLYKSQLKERKNKYTNHITFKDSFAQSINPVFGKIGSLYLGKENLETYAMTFGFNRTIDFEVELNPSVFSISDDPYQWAEIASGFNHETNITPLHGALIAAVIINQGKLVEPTIVDKIVDEKERVVYHGESAIIRQVIAPDTANIILHFMEETVSSGTFRKMFKGYKNNQILSRLDIGGKSGSIASPSNDVRYDWFVGFAKEKKGQEKMAIAVLVTHQHYIGKRAGEFARIAIEQYFGNYFALK